jgi:hypothetical protein
MLLGSSTVWGQLLPRRDQIPPTAPTNFRATAITDHSVTLAWDPSTDNSGKFVYHICCAGTTLTVPQFQTSITINGLDSGDTYVFRAYAKDFAGNLSKSSNPVTVTLLGELKAPSKPVVTLLDVGPTHVSLHWQSTDDEFPIWYTIFIDGRAVFTLNSLSRTIAPLEQETAYTFTVQARDVDGNNSPMSDPVIVTTEPRPPNDHTPPSPVTNVTAEIPGLILVSWAPSTDDMTPQSLIRYDVYLNGVLHVSVAGQTSAEVDPDHGLNVITVFALDESDNQSLPGTVTISYP